MLRRIIVAIATLSLVLAACGHQVTPDRSTGPGGLSPGQMQIKFNVQGTLDFTDYIYIVAFNTGQNTSGGSGEPYAYYATSQYNYRDLDFEMLVTNQNGVPAVTIYPFVNESGSAGGTIKVPANPILYNPQALQLYPNCNGQQTQFCITFDRSLLILPNTATPAPCFTFGSPSPSPTGSVSPSPSPSASASPSASPSSSASPAPGACPWYLNWWVATPNGSGTPGQVVDAPGLNGVLDQSNFNFNIDTTTSSSCNYAACLWTAVLGWPQAPSESAQISGGQVINSPL